MRLIVRIPALVVIRLLVHPTTIVFVSSKESKAPVPSSPPIASPPLSVDRVAIIPVKGVAIVTPGWKDSYSVGDRCYCLSGFDGGIGTALVDTPLGRITVAEACALLGPGPGSAGRPVYNDIQCGNGPPNNTTHEVACPGRTDHGVEGCSSIGPKWNFDPSNTQPQQQQQQQQSPSERPSYAPTISTTKPTVPIPPPTQSPPPIPITIPIQVPTTTKDEIPESVPTPVPILITQAPNRKPRSRFDDLPLLMLVKTPVIVPPSYLTPSMKVPTSPNTEEPEIPTTLVVPTTKNIDTSTTLSPTFVIIPTQLPSPVFVPIPKVPFTLPPVVVAPIVPPPTKPIDTSTTIIQPPKQSPTLIPHNYVRSEDTFVPTKAPQIGNNLPTTGQEPSPSSSTVSKPVQVPPTLQLPPILDSPVDRGGQQVPLPSPVVAPPQTDSTSNTNATGSVPDNDTDRIRSKFSDGVDASLPLLVDLFVPPATKKDEEPIIAPSQSPSVTVASPVQSPPLNNNQSTVVPLLLDNTNITNYILNPDMDIRWLTYYVDSYSVEDRCYCSSEKVFNTTFKLGSIIVDTPRGKQTVADICKLLGPGPGKIGRPLYNDIQCGNGPKTYLEYDGTCPGRIDHGATGCNYIGPKWNFN